MTGRGMSEQAHTPRLTFAIGDIHGRLDLLLVAAERIQQRLNGGEGKVVCLGDYVDRGPDSRGVIEFLMGAANGGLTCLKGNHEAMMVAACRAGAGSQEFFFWAMNGGYQTLESYGGRIEDVPAEHLDWLDSLPVLASDEDRIYVHAGLMPGTPAAEQEEEVCLWIRDRFLSAHPRDFDKHVVHGHTHTWACKETATPELLEHRTNLDTAAYHTGVLSVAVFEEGKAGPTDVISARATPSKSGDA